jgi:sugar O-acyltransferase (sialic acid O-acetyltransferase NeuD family)
LEEKPLVIFGNRDTAELAAFYFDNDSDREVAAFTVDQAYLTDDKFVGRPLVAFETVEEQYPPDAYDLFVAVSYARMNRVRAEKVAAAKEKGYRLVSYVSSRATVWTDRIGSNCFIFEDNTIQPFVTIGDSVTLWSGNHIGHHSTISDNVFISSHVVVSGRVQVGSNSFIGVNATIRDRVTIAPFTLIAAGAVILEDTEAEGVYPCPAPAVKHRVKSTQLKRI